MQISNKFFDGIFFFFLKGKKNRVIVFEPFWPSHLDLKGEAIHTNRPIFYFIFQKSSPKQCGRLVKKMTCFNK